MKVCITPSSLNLFAVYYKPLIKEALKTTTTSTSANELIKGLYDKALNHFKEIPGLTKEETQELILQHSIVIPQLALQLMSSIPLLNVSALKDDVSVLAANVYTATQKDVTAMQNLITDFGKLIGNTVISIDDIDESSEYNSGMILETVTLSRTLNKLFVWDPIAKTYAANVLNPNKIFEGDIQRNIINKANASNYKLQVMTLNDVLDNPNFKNTFDDGNLPSHVLVLVNDQGNIVLFNENAEVSVTGQFPAFVFNHNQKEWNHVTQNLIKDLLKQKFTEEQAKARANQLVSQHKELIYQQLSKFAAGETIRFNIDIAQSTGGLFIKDFNQKSNLSDVANVDNLDFRISQREEQKGYTVTAYLKNNPAEAVELHGKPVNSLTDEELMMVAKLIADKDIKINTTGIDGTTYSPVIPLGLGQSIKDKSKLTRVKLLSTIFESSQNSVSIYMKPVEGTKHFERWVRIGSQEIKVPINQPEIILDVLKEWSNSKKVIPFQQGIGMSTPRVIKLEDAKHLDVIAINGVPHLVVQPQLSLGVSLNTDIKAKSLTIPVSIDENNVMTTKVVSVKDQLVSRAITPAVVNANNELINSNPYLGFSITEESIAEEDNGIDDLVVFKTLEENNLSSSATTDDEAIEWFKNSPLSQLVTLNFKQQLHARGPQYVAEFVNGAINMYYGSTASEIYHEAFHAFFNALLSPQERADIYSDLKKIKGEFTTVVLAKSTTVSFKDATDLELEEYLANQYQAYHDKRASKKQGKLSTRITQFFDKVKNILNAIFGDMSLNDAIALNKFAGVTNSMFNALYEGNIDTSKFVSHNPKAIYKSQESPIGLSNEQIALLMNSITSLVSEFADQTINQTDTISQKKSRIVSYIKAAQHPEGSPEYNDLMNKLDQTPTAKLGDGLLLLKTDAIFMSNALVYIKTALNNRLKYFEGMEEGYVQKYNVHLLSTALKHFSNGMTLQELLDSKNTDTIAGLYLNHYSFFNTSNIKDDDELDAIDDGNFEMVFGNETDKLTLAEQTDEHTKELLSGIHAHTGNGEGVPVVNMLGIKTTHTFGHILNKVAKLLNNVHSEEKMYQVLKQAAAKDKEIAQVLAKLGELDHPSITDAVQKQWTGFWQVMAKATVKLTGMALERTISEDASKPGEFKVTITSKIGKMKNQQDLIGKGWRAKFDYLRDNGVGFYTSTSKSMNEAGQLVDVQDPFKSLHVASLFKLEKFNEVRYVQRTDRKFAKHSAEWLSTQPRVLTEEEITDEHLAFYTKTTKAFADPVNFLSFFGIDLVDSEDMRKELFKTDAFPWLYKSIYNRQFAVNKKQQRITSLNDLIYTAYDYSDPETGTTWNQENTSGHFKTIQRLQYELSDELIGFMEYNANGDKQSEKVLFSSLTKMTTNLNEANHYRELIQMPGMEMFDYEKNPSVAASRLFRKRFQLNLPIGHPQRGYANEKVKFTVNTLSGSQIISKNALLNTSEYGDKEEYSVLNIDEDKGISQIGSDKMTKFISDFHLTLGGQQEILRSADKTTSHTVYTDKEMPVGYYEVLALFKGDVTASNLYDHFIRHIEFELVRYDRMKDLAEEIKNASATDEIHFDADYLNRAINEPFFNFKDMLSAKTRNQLLQLGVMEMFSIEDNITDELKVSIEKELHTYFQSKANDLYEEMKDTMIIADNIYEQYSGAPEFKSIGLAAGEKITDAQVKENTNRFLFHMFAVNNHLNNFDYSSLFLGDVANYNLKKKDFSKRIPGLISNGKSFRYGQSWLRSINKNNNAYGFSKNERQYTGYLNTAIMNEMKAESVNLAQYRDVLGIDTTAYSADEMKEADGFGVIGFDAYRLLNMSCNEWSDAQEKLYQKMLSGEEIETSDLKATFPLRKFQYFGPIINTDSKQDFGLGMQAFHKYSLMPLIPALIKGTKLEALHNDMMEQNIDYTTFQSGSKVSSISKVVYNKEQDKFEAQVDTPYTKDRKYQKVKFVKNTIHTAFLKNQIFIQEGFKGKVTLSTQKRLMALHGLSDNGVPTSPENAAILERHKRIMFNLKEVKKQKFLKNFSLKQDDEGNYIGDSTKLVEYLKEKLASKDLLPEEISYLVKPDGTLLDDLSFSLHSSKIETLLMTLADNELRKLKVTGEALVQVPHTMWETMNADQTLSEEDKKTFGTNGLRFYTLKNADGTEATSETGHVYVTKMEVKIALQGGFKHLLNLTHPDGNKMKVYTEDGKYDYNASLRRLNESIKNEEWNKEHAKFLNITGDRIPGQGPNALEAITIAEFLPEYFGASIILPAEIVAKAGSDYDIDKLFCHFPAIVNYNGKVELQRFLKDVTETEDELKTAIRNDRESLKHLVEQINALQKARDEFYESLPEENNKLDKKAFSQITSARADLSEKLYKLYATGSSEFYQEEATQLQDEIDNLDALLNMHEESIGISTAFTKFKTDIAKLKNAKGIIDNAIVEKQRKINGLSTKGLENLLLDSYLEIITRPSHLKELVTANTTATFTEGANGQPSLAADMRNKVANKYAKTKRVFDTTSDASWVSPSELHTYRFNLDMHQSNSGGMDSLGILAIASTFYAAFTSMGANIATEQAEKIKKFNTAVKILHDPKVNPEFKQKNEANAIKLLNDLKLYPEIKFKHNDDNGAIALGKRLNSVQANIADLFSQLINGSVDVAKDAWIFDIQGTKENIPHIIFMLMSGVDIKTAIYLSCNPLVLEYNRLKKASQGVFNHLTTDPKLSAIPSYTSPEEIRGNLFRVLTDKGLIENGIFPYQKHLMMTSNNLEERLYDMIGKPWDKSHLDALAQYLVIEDMSNDVTQFTMLTKYDTQKVRNISDATSRLSDTKSFVEAANNNEKYVPSSWFESFKTTPKGVFNNDALLVGLFDKKFGVRNHPLVVQASVTIRKKGMIPSVLRNDFKDDFLWFLYQNSLFNNNNYDGKQIVYNADHEGVQIIDNKISVGKTALANKINTENYHLLHHNFKTQGDYIRFAYEYKKLESLNRQQLSERYDHIATDRYSEVYARQLVALFNARNTTAMFSTATSYATIFLNLKKKFSNLDQYSIVKDMQYAIDNKLGKMNLYLPNISEPDMLGRYRENLAELRNDASPQVREFFTMFDTFAVLQTGMNRSSQFDLGRLVSDQGHIEQVIDNGIGLDKLQEEFDTVKKIRLQNFQNKNNSKYTPISDASVIDQFKDLFKDMLDEKFSRVKGYNYLVDNLEFIGSNTPVKTQPVSSPVEAFDTLISEKPTNNQPIGLFVGQYVKYQDETYIITKSTGEKTWQIYNPLLEGVNAKKNVSIDNLIPTENSATVVNHKGNDYIVTAKNTIISLTTNKKMNWGEENGDRQAILKSRNQSQMDLTNDFDTIKYPGLSVEDKQTILTNFATYHYLEKDGALDTEEALSQMNEALQFMTEDEKIAYLDDIIKCYK